MNEDKRYYRLDLCDFRGKFKGVRYFETYEEAHVVLKHHAEWEIVAHNLFMYSYENEFRFGGIWELNNKREEAFIPMYP